MCNLIGLSGLFVLFFLLILLCVTNSALCGDYTAVGLGIDQFFRYDICIDTK